MNRILSFVAVVGVIVLIGFWLLPSLATPLHYVRRTDCKYNLRKIADALHEYHEVHQSFPPAYIADAAGKPIHSWRVLILPYLDNPEARAIHRQYRFDEPWDGPNNRKLHNAVVAPFVCPSNESPPSRPLRRTTSYVAVVGPGTCWHGTMPVKIADIKDGTFLTILLIEMHDSGIHWLEPRDLSFSEMSFQINDRARLSISSGHGSAKGENSTRGAQVAFVDGTIFFLQEGVPAETVRALLTTCGDEQISDPQMYPPKE